MKSSLGRWFITYKMELDMDKSDSKRRKEVALHGSEKCKGVKCPYELGSDDDLALFVK